MLCVGVLGVLTLSAFASGCSNAADPGVDTAGTGTIDLPLTAQADGVQYQLANARFIIKGTSLSFSRVIQPPASLPIDQEVLPTGDYSILLADGWQLLAKGPNDPAFSPVDAVLAVNNPLSFSVARGLTVDVIFVFLSKGIPIPLQKGRANVRISVSDCSGYNSTTASLAGFTVDCLHTIDQNSYLIDENGFLTRNFTECQDDQTLLDSIDGLLGLQYTDRDPLPFEPNALTYAKDCIAGQWAAWRETFDATQTTACPTWTKAGVINQPTLELYQQLAKSEPQLPFQENGSRPEVLSQFKINSVYTTDLAGEKQPCGSAGSCATLCASGFPGFVLDQNEDSITTDPPPWNDPTQFDPAADPYQPSYYHPMSFYGDTVPPGVLVGSVVRANALISTDGGMTFSAGEKCSVYSGNSHVGGRLVPNCRINPTNGNRYACVGFCTPDGTQLPPPTNL
jgi:hypothetical protein